MSTRNNGEMSTIQKSFLEALGGGSRKRKTKATASSAGSFSSLNQSAATIAASTAQRIDLLIDEQEEKKNDNAIDELERLLTDTPQFPLQLLRYLYLLVRELSNPRWEGRWEWIIRGKGFHRNSLS